uniref:Orphan G-protein coupled receptor 37 n=1 Tax=Platynereis dumerilii TaxID=6359 RepID=A0A0K0PUH4_PLADU|nr:orphan G-protein coupled receptor 37 [Platynereis dumerilii]
MGDQGQDPDTSSVRDYQASMAYNTVVFYNNSPAEGNLSNFTTAPLHNEDLTSMRTLWEVIFLGTLLGCVIITTILGNLLVMVTVITNRKLHSATNYFILCLAVADFLLGCLVLPFSAVNTLHWEWPFGAAFCNIFISTDVMLCTVSILTLFAISIDRYYAVTEPLNYQCRVTSSLVWKICTAIWCFSFALAFIPIHIGLNTNDGSVQNYEQPKLCNFELNKVYVLIDSLGTYFAPLIVMCIVYMKVLIITKKQVIEINKLQKAALASGLHSEENKHHAKMASDTKATITLASLVLAFAICWVPYFVLFTAKPFVSEPFNMHLDLCTLWLGYLNSLINPFLYAYYNTAFRKAFVRILCRSCQLHRRRQMRTCIGGQFKGGCTDSSELSALNGRPSM